MLHLSQRAILSTLILLAMTAKAERPAFDGSLADFLLGQSARFGPAVQHPQRHRLQVIYTRIERAADNSPSFTSYTYRANGAEYFYPASTVKLPTALFALQRLNALAIDGVTRDTPMCIDPVPASDCPSIADDVRKILLVSDNEAYNRLYEFLGYDKLNAALRDHELADTRIVHRLERALSEQENRQTAEIRFLDNGQTIYRQPAQGSATSLRAANPILLGRGEMSAGELINGPKDFAGKNAYPLQAQHDLLLTLLFPGAVAPQRRLNLTDEDYQLIYRAMSATPASSGISEYADREQYPDGYVKFLLYGGDAPTIPANIRIFNKSGQAYGFLSDAAYIVDLERGVEFILAATVYSNANGIFNDDDYEYDSIGFPFLRELGRAIYELELERERAVKPDLSAFELP